MQTFFRFFISKTFLISLGLAIVLGFVGYFVVFSWIDSHTQHGETITVPDFTGVHFTELEKLAGDKELKVVVVDSVYVKGVKRGTAIDQDPKPGSYVKRQRTVYITVNKNTVQMHEMPKVTDVSVRFATSILEIQGLEVKEIIMKPGFDGYVLKQLYKGEEIEPGTPVEDGAAISLVVGQGQTGEKILIPNLLGLTIDEAKQRLNERSLNLGAEVYYNCTTKEDSLQASISKQSPPAKAQGLINYGGSIDVWLQKSPTDTIPSAADTINTGNGE